MPVEGMPHNEIEQVYGSIKNMMDGWLPKGSYTDDTQLMIGLAESLIECRGFSGAHMSRQFISNFEPHRGYGPGTIRVLNNVKEGQGWHEAASHLYGGGSYGNGAAMRIAPVGILYYDQPEKLKQVAEVTSRITHAHPLGVEGAVLQATAVGLAANVDLIESGTLNKIDFIEQLIAVSTLDEYQTKLDMIKSFITGPKNHTNNDIISALGVGVQAHKSVPMAIYCFLEKCGSYRDAVCYAVNMGGDTDTIGAMTGALAGALHGVRGIPEEWLEDLENSQKGRDHIMKLGEDLYDLHIN
ncbi:MAG: ADP-ribosylglycohydrolase family protein [Thermoplasmata archaeon]|nr:MAG: ADP-ribosylglycohydrolase family protein [Thermoplasmata archaeon]